MACLRSYGFMCIISGNFSLGMHGHDLAVDSESSMALIQSALVVLPSCPPLTLTLPPGVWVLFGCSS